MRDIALVLCLLDEFLDLGVVQIEHWTVFSFHITVFVLILLGFRHVVLPPVAVPVCNIQTNFASRSVLIGLFCCLIETRCASLAFSDLMVQSAPVLR